MNRLAHRVATKWLESAVSGPDACPTCRGTGFLNLGDCPNCGGTGKKPRPESSTIYRVITDEPIGWAIGFKPSQSVLDEIGASFDEWTLINDDGRMYGTIVFAGDSKEELVMLPDLPSDEQLQNGMVPVGMDMDVWRSEDEMLSALA